MASLKVAGVFTVFGLLLWLIFAFPTLCTSIPNEVSERGSHGFRLWQGPSLKSFSQSGGKICVPRGWIPIGATAEGNGWASFSPDTTGVFIQSRDFASTTLSFSKSAFVVTLMYPTHAASSELSEYKKIVTNTFESAGSLFRDSGTPRPHTVVVTAGLGDSGNERDSIYPDPNGAVSYLILKPNHTRAEELFIHAIMHLYNRYRPDLDRYEEAQQPLSSIDFQEMEAAWSETAFEASNANRLLRLQYLYQVHQAVLQKNFSLIRAEPFTNKDAFMQLQPGLPTTASSTYLDYQYNHYILAPLVLTAIEGMLAAYHPSTTVSSLLTRLHENPSQSFFELLKPLLPEKALREITTWMNGNTEIPVRFITAAIARYDTSTPN